MSLFETSPPVNNVDVNTYRGPSIPLSFFKKNVPGRIIRISGKEDVKRFLTGLGFITGTEIRLVNSVNGSVIVDVRGSRIAIDSDMASKIMCAP